MAAATPDQIASWPPPNFEDPESRGPVVIGLTVSTLALMVLFTAARFYGRGVLTAGALGVDDWIMGTAMIFAIGVSALALACLRYGLGLHMWDQKPDWSQPYNKMGYAADILFPIATGLTKISLCLTYLKLFPSRTNKIFCYFLSTFVTLYTLTCLLLMFFQCTPVSGYWNPSVKQTCIKMRPTLISIAALNSLSDILTFLWPAKSLWTVQLPLKQRLGLILIFAIGCTVCGAGICRIYYLNLYFGSYDLLWNAAAIWEVMTVETNAGIVFGCAAGVKPVVMAVFPGGFGRLGSRPSQGRSSQSQPQSQPNVQRDSGHQSGNTDGRVMVEVAAVTSVTPEEQNDGSSAYSDQHVGLDVPQNEISEDITMAVCRP